MKIDNRYLTTEVHAAVCHLLMILLSKDFLGAGMSTLVAVLSNVITLSARSIHHPEGCVLSVPG